jgi:glyoxylase-like metal-dependent hydrolase (beta-lactamase superfamily II)
VEEILPGLYHWTAFHEGIRMEVSSHFVADSGALIDPMSPAEGLEWFERRPPGRIVLTNRHHYRHSDRFAEAFGCPVLCNEAGLHEFEGGPDVRGFAVGDRIAPHIVAREMGGICPDDTALHIQQGDGVLALADALIRYGGSLSFVPDSYFDDPKADQQAIRASLERLLELDFDSLLFAHGEPLVGGAKEALRRFLEA